MANQGYQMVHCAVMYLWTPGHTLLCCGVPLVATDTSESGCPRRGQPGLFPPEDTDSQSETFSVSLTVTCCVLIGRAYLCGGHVVFERVDGEAEDVVVVAEVKPLTVLQPVVDDGDGGHVVHHLPRLTVEQVVTTVKAPIPAGNRKQHHHSKGPFI